ncbi:hypothetical protein T484DRAFT_2509562 [Baffinella frigidus]|nr:hypothetical protein T484DRAFT_2509562 [Cryptophyta sp. CCMP2293]
MSYRRAVHRKAILCGDTTCIRLRSKTLREHRSRTLVVSDISRAKLAASGNPISEATEALFTSVVKGDLQGLDKALKQEGVDVNATDGSKNTPLHWAASSGGVDAGRMLLDAGADLTTRGHGGDQPLHIAAAHGACPPSASNGKSHRLL